MIQLTHYDLDGAVCTIILKAIYGKFKYYCCGYEKKDKKIMEILEREVPQELFVTDFVIDIPNIKKLSKKFDVTYIDHHEESISNDIGRFVKSTLLKTDQSAALLCYEFFKDQMFLLDTKGRFKKLCEITSDYDLWIHKFKSSYYLNELFWHHGFFNFVDIFDNGFEKFSVEQVNIVESKIKQKIETFKTIEKIEIADSTLFLNGDTNSMLILNDIGFFHPNCKLYFFYDKSTKGIHIRIKTNNSKVNLNSCMDIVFSGNKSIKTYGGHPYAGAFYMNGEPSLNEIIEVAKSLSSEILKVLT